MAALAAAPCPAAKKAKPPSQEIRQDHRHAVLAIARQRPEPGKVTFEKRADLFAGAPATFTVRMDEPIAAGLRLGEAYVVCYTSWVKRRFPGVSGEDPEGPSLLRIPGVSESLFADTPEVRKLLAGEAEGRRPKTLRRLLVRGLGSSHPRTQRLFAAEIVFRELLGELSKRQLTAVAEHIRGARNDAAAREMLLLAGMQPGSPADGRWLEAARGILATTPVELDLTSYTPSLVRSTLRVLRGGGEPADLPALGRWLAANNRAVVEAAIQAMVTLDPGGAETAVRAVLEEGRLSAEGRGWVEGYLRRFPPARED